MLVAGSRHLADDARVVDDDEHEDRREERDVVDGDGRGPTSARWSRRRICAHSFGSDMYRSMDWVFSARRAPA